MTATSVHARFPPTHLRGQTHGCEHSSCVKPRNERACKTDALAGTSDQACLSAAAAWSLVWARSSEKLSAITYTLQVADEHFTNSVQVVRAKSVE